jgi:hypothetical protein
MVHLGKLSETKPVVSVSLEDRAETTKFLVTIPESETIEEPSNLTTEGSSLVLGFREPDYGDHSLDRMLTSLVPSYREATSPIPISTYLGKEVTHRVESSGALGVSTCEGEDSRKDYAWLRGLGYEFSSIKTRSARKKAGTNTTFSKQHLSINSEL